jgi:hypothetical protein
MRRQKEGEEGISRADLPSCGEMADHHRRIIREPNTPMLRLLNYSNIMYSARRRVKKLPSQVSEIPTCGTNGFCAVVECFRPSAADFRRPRSKRANVR